MEWPLVTLCSYKLPWKAAISSKVTTRGLELVYSSLSEWLHAFRNTNSFFRVRPKYRWAQLSERCAERWGRSVCYLAFCRANHLVTVKSTPTTLLLPLAFYCHEWSHATTFCAKCTWTDRLTIWVLRRMVASPLRFIYQEMSCLYYRSPQFVFSTWESMLTIRLYIGSQLNVALIKDHEHTLNWGFGFCLVSNL